MTWSCFVPPSVRAWCARVPERPNERCEQSSLTRLCCDVFFRLHFFSPVWMEPQKIDLNQGSSVLDASWTQTAADVTITLQFNADSIKAADVKCNFQGRALDLAINGQHIFASRAFPTVDEYDYAVVARDCVWSVADNTSLLLHLPKAEKSVGFWTRLFETDEVYIDISKLGHPPHYDPKKPQPVKVEDPEMLQKLAKEHPELNLKVPGQKGAEVGTQAGAFKGQSSFSW